MARKICAFTLRPAIVRALDALSAEYGGPSVNAHGLTLEDMQILATKLAWKGRIPVNPDAMYKSATNRVTLALARSWAAERAVLNNQRRKSKSALVDALLEDAIRAYAKRNGLAVETLLGEAKNASQANLGAVARSNGGGRSTKPAATSSLETVALPAV